MKNILYLLPFLFALSLLSKCSCKKEEEVVKESPLDVDFRVYQEDSWVGFYEEDNIKTLQIEDDTFVSFNPIILQAKPQHGTISSWEIGEDLRDFKGQKEISLFYNLSKTTEIRVRHFLRKDTISVSSEKTFVVSGPIPYYDSISGRISCKQSIFGKYEGYSDERPDLLQKIEIANNCDTDILNFRMYGRHPGVLSARSTVTKNVFILYRDYGINDDIISGYMRLSPTNHDSIIIKYTVIKPEIEITAEIADRKNRMKKQYRTRIFTFMGNRVK